MKDAILQIMKSSARELLFEYNDEITRSWWKTDVEFKLNKIMESSKILNVICDETNNNCEIIASHKFVGEVIYEDEEETEWPKHLRIEIGPEGIEDE